MRRTLNLRSERLQELTPADLSAVRGGTNSVATDGHHCFGTCVCPPPTRVRTVCDCVTPVTVGC